MENKSFNIIPCTDRDTWLTQRRRGVGGSDIAAIMGLSPYRSAYSVWAEKTGQMKPADISDKPAVHWGTVLEPVLGDEYARRHPDRTIRRIDGICQSKSRPWALATIDYEVYDPDLGWGVLEIKTTGSTHADEWTDSVPIHYQTQVTHYMSVLDRPFADVAVLIGGQDYREIRLMRDADDEAAVIDAVDAFWHDHVIARVAPPITGSYDDSAAVFAVHKQVSEDFIQVDTCDAVDAYLHAKAEKESADTAYRKAVNLLKEQIGKHKGIKTDKGRFTWSRGQVSHFDAKAFDTDHPHLRDKYIHTTTKDYGIRYARK